LWVYLAAAPPDKPTKKDFSGAYGPQPPTSPDFAIALRQAGQLDARASLCI
jgi:hypothetical protein